VCARAHTCMQVNVAQTETSNQQAP